MTCQCCGAGCARCGTGPYWGNRHDVGQGPQVSEPTLEEINDFWQGGAWDSKESGRPERTRASSSLSCAGSSLGMISA